VEFPQLYLLSPTKYELARPILNALDHHLAVACLLEGTVPSRIYVDHPEHPTAALAVASRRYFLAGNPENDSFNHSLQQLFADTIYPQALAAGETMFVLYYQTGGWTDKLELILKDKYPIFAQRQFYQLKELKTDWRSLLPEGFALQHADREILADPQIMNPDFLTEEMCSERESVEDFLQKSFGLCLVHDHEIVGWCLSEYNHAAGCEIGIATSPAYQRRGFATLLASAFIEYAHSQGLTHIGWHCYASNAPSVATALKLGFEKVTDYPICLGWFNPADALAVQGDVCFDRQQYTEALAWLEKAFAHQQEQGWAYWVAACSAATLGESEKAFRYLHQSVEKGFADQERLRDSPYLESLHDHPEWQQMVSDL
jgi:RimJ/RimL family protein N-acetyltransferase